MQEVSALITELKKARKSLCALELCIQEKLIVKEGRFSRTVNAVLVRVGNSKLIIVNRRLRRVEKCLAIYHELWHHFTGVVHRSPFHRNELEADLFARGIVLAYHREKAVRCKLKNGRLECVYLALVIRTLQKEL